MYLYTCFVLHPMFEHHISGLKTVFRKNQGNALENPHPSMAEVGPLIHFTDNILNQACVVCYEALH